MIKEIKLPTYKDGTPIRFGESIYNYEGRTFAIQSVELFKDGGSVFYGLDEDGKSRYVVVSSKNFVKRADSWEQLEKDAEKEACDYFGMAGKPDCKGCRNMNGNSDKYSSFDVSCKLLQKKDLVRRAKKLAGVEDE